MIHFQKLTLGQKCRAMLLAGISGVIGTIAAYIFEALIALVHNITFEQKLSLIYHHTQHTSPNKWGAIILIFPVLGAFIVRWILSTYARESSGLSVSEIMYAIHHQQAKVSLRMSLAKIMAASISIGTGGSIGREGPFMQIGSAISSIISDLTNITNTTRTILIASGAAAIMTATFHAPLAGIAFAIEFLLLSFNLMAIACVATATITSTLFSYMMTGAKPLFILTSTSYLEPDLSISSELILFSLLGIMLGLFSSLFIQSLYWTQDALSKLIHNSYVRHAVGMLLVGAIFYILLIKTGHYYVEGIGFAFVQDTLNFVIQNPWLLITIVLLKYVATCLTLGSGASGGIFAPALFIGAGFGSVFCLLAGYYYPPAALDPSLFVLAGMAAMLAATTGAVMTALMLVLEAAWYYHALLPLLICITVAYVIRRLICRDSIYTLKFSRVGIHLPQWI